MAKSPRTKIKREKISRISIGIQGEKASVSTLFPTTTVVPTVEKAFSSYEGAEILLPPFPAPHEGVMEKEVIRLFPRLRLLCLSGMNQREAQETLEAVLNIGATFRGLGEEELEILSTLFPLAALRGGSILDFSRGFAPPEKCISPKQPFSALTYKEELRAEEGRSFIRNRCGIFYSLPMLRGFCAALSEIPGLDSLFACTFSGATIHEFGHLFPFSSYYSSSVSTFLHSSEVRNELQRGRDILRRELGVDTLRNLFFPSSRGGKRRTKREFVHRAIKTIEGHKLVSLYAYLSPEELFAESFRVLCSPSPNRRPLFIDVFEPFMIKIALHGKEAKERSGCEEER
ncbi:MAG: hypothetical protein QXH08_00265 [Candidatus Hadarchaeales archaeon]